MFGYISPLVPELKVKEHEAYKGYYCGLCKTIKEKYSNAARFMLSYDCAVLSLLLSSMSDGIPNVKKERCIANPLKKKTIIRSAEAKYAAGVNMLLGYGKLRDTVADDRKISAFVLLGIFRRQFRHASKDFSGLAEQFELRLNNLSKLEKKGCTSIDEVSAEFGYLLASVFSMAPMDFMSESTSKIMGSLGYNLGRWIYIADAVDDIIKDNKKSNYNVYLQREYSDIREHREAIKEEAQFSMHYTLSEACKAYELLDIKRDKEIMNNIMYKGLAKKTEDILKGDIDGSV